MTAAEAIAGAVLAALFVWIVVEEGEHRREEQATWSCLAATPDVTDSNVQQVYEACALLAEHRRMVGR